MPSLQIRLMAWWNTHLHNLKKCEKAAEVCGGFRLRSMDFSEVLCRVLQCSRYVIETNYEIFFSVSRRSYSLHSFLVLTFL